MERKRELEYGKVMNYDGYNGNIKGVDGNSYLFSQQDIVNKEVIQSNDIVSFDKENIKGTELENLLIARFVKKLKKDVD